MIYDEGPERQLLEDSTAITIQADTGPHKDTWLKELREGWMMCKRVGERGQLGGEEGSTRGWL